MCSTLHLQECHLFDFVSVCFYQCEGGCGWFCERVDVILVFCLFIYGILFVFQINKKISVKINEYSGVHPTKTTVCVWVRVVWCKLNYTIHLDITGINIKI